MISHDPIAIDTGHRVLAAILSKPELLDEVPELEVDDFCEEKQRTVWTAIRTLVARGKPPTPEGIDEVLRSLDEVRGSRLHIIAGSHYLRSLFASDATPDRARDAGHVKAWATLLRRDRERVELEIAELLEQAAERERVEAEVDEFALRDVDLSSEVAASTGAAPSPAGGGTPRPHRVGRRRAQLVAEIRKLAKEPTLELRIGGRSIARVRPGGIVTLVGGSGRGKTSLGATIAIEHARDVGPAIIYSLELPAYEFGARGIGIDCDTGWMAVLEGCVPDERMLASLPDRLSIIDRSEATPAALEAEIDGMRAEFPGEPILILPDYVQLMEVAGAQLGQQRAVADQAMRIIDRIARTKLVVALVLSQGSRASAKALASGEIIGAQTTDAGAESAAIERWASCTLAIGEHGETGPDGSCPAPINVGKGRMLEGGGDAVIDSRYHGRSGRWWLEGDARKASDVRKERESARDQKKRETLKRSITDLVSKSDRALSKSEITERTQGNNKAIADAIKDLIRDQVLAHDHAGAKYGHAPIWTPERIANAAGNEA